jgi:hypothetical protein
MGEVPCRPCPASPASAAALAMVGWASPVPVQMWAGVSPVPAQMWAGVSPVPGQMWAGVRPVPRVRRRHVLRGSTRQSVGLAHREGTLRVPADHLSPVSTPCVPRSSCEHPSGTAWRAFLWSASAAPCRSSRWSISSLATQRGRKADPTNPTYPTYPTNPTYSTNPTFSTNPALSLRKCGRRRIHARVSSGR